MFDWILDSERIDAAVATFIAFVGGGVSRLLYERHSQRFFDTGTLLEMHEKGHLGRYGRLRLQSESLDALVAWQAELLPPAIGTKLDNWPDAEITIVAKSIADGVAASRCPRLTNEEHARRPLYFTVTQSIQTVDASDRYTHALTEQLKKVAANHPGSAALIKYRVADDRKPARVWVSFSELQVTSADQLRTVAETVARELRRWIPRVTLVLETYIADDVQLALDSLSTTQSIAFAKHLLLQDGETSTLSRQGYTTSEHYAIGRTLAYYALGMGAFLDVADTASSYAVTNDILEQRFKRIFTDGNLNPTRWACLSLFGPPGSGKTELARMCAKKLVDEHNALVIALNTEGSLAALEFLATGAGENEARQALLPALRTIMPMDGIEGDDWNKGFVDAFLSRARSAPEQVIWVLDDLLPRTKLKEIIKGVIAGDSPKKPHFILVGRPRLDFLSESEAIFVECEHWGRTEATRLLRSWVAEGFKSQAASALKSGWAEKRTTFSTYHLRVLVQCVDRPDLAPSTIMRQELQRMTAPLGDHLTALHRPPERVLMDIRKMLNAGVPSSEVLASLDASTQIDVVRLLGQLSWSSKYNQVAYSPSSHGDLHAIMSRSRLVEWSSRQIRDADEAEAFIRICAQAGIFRQVRGEGGAVWTDNFIADGFAAHYISTDVLSGEDEVSEVTIALMVEKLHERNSLEILPFALRADQLAHLIKAVALKRPGIVHAFASLLSDETVATWLKDVPGLSDGITYALLSAAKDLDLAQLGSLGVTFAIMTKVSPTAALLEAQSLGYESCEGLLSLAGVAASAESLPAFYRRADSLGIDRRKSTVLSSWFARKASRADYRARITDLLNSGASADEVSEMWGRWCADSDGNLLANDVYGLLEKHIEDSVALVKLIDITCNDIADRHLVKKSLNQASLTAAVRYLHTRGSVDVAECVVKWIAYFWHPEVSGRSDRWVLDRAGKIAIQSSSHIPAKVSEVFAKLRASAGASLPSSRQIKEVLGDYDQAAELVSDGLPPGFKFDGDIIRGWIMCTQGGDVRPVDLVNELPSMKFQWRVSVSLK